MAAEGRLGLDEANRFTTILANTANLLGYKRIGELREMIEEFEKPPVERRVSEGVMFPKWGGISERGKPS